MKKTIFNLILVLGLSSGLLAQTTVFTENFEGTTFNVSSSGSANWAVSNSLSVSGAKCDSAALVNINDSAILTTNTFSTSGNSNVLLEFNHICKLEFYDAGTIEVSADNGTTWAQLTGTHYLGSGQFGNIGNRFCAVSYVDWAVVNNNAIPTNSWWKAEVFDISALVANTSQVKVRFKIMDINNSGGVGAYGWLIDDIKITVASGEMIPPSVSLNLPILTDSVYNTGPFDIYADIADASGIDTAMVVYTINSNTDTVGMTLQSGNTYLGSIPSQPYNTDICYQVVAIDNSAISNKTTNPVSCLPIYVRKGVTNVQIGLGSLSNSSYPLYTVGSSVNLYSNHISLFTPAEMGITGQIKMLSWLKDNANGYNNGDGKLKIYLKHSTSTFVNSTTVFATEVSGATLVYDDTTQNLMSNSGWQQFVFNTANAFSYNGNDNLMVLVEWHHPTVAPASVSWNYTSIAGHAISFYGSTANPTTSTGAGNRPNITFGMIPTIYAFDAGVSQFISPLGVQLSSSSVPVQVRVQNFGNDTLKKVTVNWELDGTPKTPVVWTGSLLQDMVTNTITLGNETFPIGPHNINAWTSLPNDSADLYNANDTIYNSFFACSNILNGTYTVGGASADFTTIADVITALNNCGVAGPTIFKINSGVYNEQIVLSDSIPGLSAINTITFTSVTGDSSDVILEYATDANSNYVVLIDGADYITISNLTLKSTGTTHANVVSLANNAVYNVISNCVIIAPAGNNYDVRNINLSNESNNNNSFINNRLLNAYYGVHLAAGSSGRQYGNRVEGNIIHDFWSYGIYAAYQDSSTFNGNDIFTNPGHTSTIYGIGLTHCEGGDVVVSGNNIHIVAGASFNGIRLSYSSGSFGNENLVSNNMIIIEGPSTSTWARAVYSEYSNHYKFYNNSIMQKTGANPESYCFSGSATGVQFRNNILSNYSGGVALKIFSSAAGVISASDYNNFYTTGGSLIDWGGTLVPTSTGAAGIPAITTKDSNSFVSDPKFYLLDNLHSYSAILNGAGDAVPEVTIDIDGDPRNVSTPDIGADEYDLAPIDVGAIKILDPIAVDTQNRVIPVKVIIGNFGTTTVTSMNIKYSVDGGTPVNYAWTGSIIGGTTDTISIANLIVPVTAFNLCVYTDLATDTITFNDMTCGNYYGLPLKDVKLISFDAPGTGCGLGQETVSITIANLGINNITSGLVAKYKVAGSSTIVSDTVTAVINAGDTLSFDFTTKVDMTVTTTDSIFDFIAWLELTGDPIQINDTISGQATSQSSLPIPAVTISPFNYGDTVVLTATSPDAIYWFDSDTASVEIATGPQYTTPPLFDTTTYYVKASNFIPSQTAVIGTGTLTNTSYSMPCAYGGTDFFGTREQFLVLASELQAQGITGGPIESIAFDVVTPYGITVNNLEISLGHSTVTSLTAFQTTGLTVVYYGNHSLVQGWNTHQFSSPFVWDGSSNLIVNICNPSTSFGGNPPMRYSTTSFNSTVHVSGNVPGGACNASSGISIQSRSNMKFTTPGTQGCSSAKGPVVINVIPPAKDARVATIVEPVSGCGLTLTDVTVDILNNGTDTINGGLSATYRIGNGAYITPENISAVISPGDTLVYTFNTQAALPAIVAGTDYVITSKAILIGDSYSANDSTISDTIHSVYTPVNPTISNTTVNYGQQAVFNVNSNDTMYWYNDSLVGNLVYAGNQFTTQPLYDTTTYFVQAQHTVGPADYLTGPGMGANISTQPPSPYGNGSWNAYGVKNQFLYKASELQALGMQKGEIESLSFRVSVVVGASYNGYEIKMGNTNQNALTAFETNLNTVFSSNSYSENNGWNLHNFQMPFYWDGVSNIIIQTCFSNNSSGAYAGVYHDTTAYVSTLTSWGAASFNCNSTSISGSYYVRPQVKFKATGYGDCISDRIPVTANVIGFPSVDAGLVEVINPLVTAPNGVSTPIKVALKNFGTNALTSATINWTLDGTLQTPAYSWAGSLPNADIDTVTIASPLFGGGNHDIKAWVSNPNTVADTININDTTTTNFDVCMSGTYAIGTNGDYQSFTDAVNIMVQAGVCGNVVFNVDSGLYVEKFVIPQISGLGPNATVTFQSATGDSTDVKIVESTTQYSNYVVRINDADYITFKKISVQANGSNYGNCFELTGNATHITIENCKLVSTLAAPTNATPASGVYSASDNVGSVHVLNNEIVNGYSGVHFDGSSSSRQYGNIIEGNNIHDFYRYGTYLRYQDSVQIVNNELETHSASSYHYGTYFYYNIGAWRISGNDFRLYGSYRSSGIHAYSSDGSSSARAGIYNNFIGLSDGTNDNIGIYIYGGDYVDCHYNSVNITAGSSSSKGLSVSSGSNLRFNNNIFAVADGDVIYANGSGTVAITVFDYNNLYAGPNNTKFAYWSAAISDFAMLKLMDVTKNVHSISINPNFYSSIDLHTDEGLLNAAGTPVAGVTIDFDGDIRNATAPDIGADEFTPAPIDLAANQIVYPAFSDCGYMVNDSIVVSVKNNGTDTIDFSVTNAQIIVMSTGATPDTITYNIASGVIYPSTLQNFVVTNTFDLSINSKYILDAYTIISNDGNALNDASPQVELMSYPTINNFPYTEDFESGYNLTFKESTTIYTHIEVTGSAASNGINGLLFRGGTGSLYNYQTVNGAYGNTNNLSVATTCDIDASNVPALKMKFDLKQMHSLTTQKYSWFRVLIHDSTGTHYLKNTVGDSTFNPVSPFMDTAKTQIFELTPWVGQVFRISLEAVTRADYTTSQSDYAMLDDFVIWVPSTTDAALTAFVQPALPIISANNLVTVEVRVENFGTDTLQTIPVGYIVNNGTPVLETITTPLAPNAVTTHVFSTQFNAAVGTYDLCAFVNVTGDITSTNDTTCVSFSGLKTYNINYCDDFEGSVDWAANGDKDQWELGTPSMTTINTTHSGTKVWATRLNSNYQTNSVEHLYSPIVIIPNNPNDTAVLEFWHWMEVQANHAYGNIQYSLNGGSTWVNLGYISSGVNWYNSNIGGYHCWSMSTSGWSYSSIKLQPSLFNTGLPVQFRFTFTADVFSANNNGWAIDDFCVTIPQAPFDAGVISINQPTLLTITGDTVTIDVTIENFGGDTLYSIPVSYVTPMGTITETVTDTLLPDSTLSYTFTAKYVSPANGYKLCSYTSLVGDVIHTNDTSCSNIMTGPAQIDAGIISILAPIGQTTIGSQYSVKATIKNFGTDTLFSIPMVFRLSGNIHAQETYIGSLLPDSTVEFTFSTQFNSPVGSYIVCVITDLIGDGNPANDSICESIIGSGINDLRDKGFIVWQNVPNPANGNTTIEYSVPTQGEIKFKLINSFGQLIRSEAIKVNAGKHKLEINSNELANGIYYYTFEFELLRKSKRMIIAR